MITREELEAALKKASDEMQQLIANYNVLLGQHSTIQQLLTKFSPGAEKIIEGAGEVLQGAAHITEGVVEVATEVGI